MSSLEVREEFIGTVDTWELRQLRWPILRAFARGFVEQRELDRYMRSLLSSGRWTSVRAAPLPEVSGAHPHLFELYGRG